MRFMERAPDGGPESTVWGFWFIEIKGLFSIVLLCFEKGSREAFHSHAFNAYTWFLKGEVDEHHVKGPMLKWRPSWKPKYTPRNCFHKVFAKRRTWALTFRGPWAKTWKEYDPKNDQITVFSHGRQVVEMTVRR